MTLRNTPIFTVNSERCCARALARTSTTGIVSQSCCGLIRRTALRKTVWCRLPDTVNGLAKSRNKSTSSATDRQAALRDPNLEIFRKRNLEVLILSDPADEYVLTTLGEFDDRKVFLSIRPS